MSKQKKQNPKEGFVKLDMPFEDALRLGMKTSPSFIQRLTLNTPVEIPNCENRTIELVYINNPDADERLSGFKIEVEVKEINSGNDKAGFYPKTISYLGLMSPYQVDEKAAFFNINSLVYIPVQKNERLFF